VKDHLLPFKNCDSAEITLKDAKARDASKKSPLKATLRLAFKGRDYSINAEETLHLVIDGMRHPLDVIISSKDPLEEVTYHTVGVNRHIGTIKEITRSKISFSLPLDYLSKISTAKTVRFEILDSALKSASPKAGYPIILELKPDSLIRDFKNNCAKTLLNNQSRG
jgi:hypothetical protein